MANESPRPQVQIINAETGNEITRDMSDDELEAFIAIQADQEILDAKATARQSALAKLADLGLTAEEIAAL